jgi:non-ribosomal peptide synthetase component F
MAGGIVEVSGPREATPKAPSASAIFRHALAKDGFPPLPGADGRALTTLYELFDHSAGKFADLPCLGHRPVAAADGGKGAAAGPYEFLTYGETAARVADVAAGLVGLGIKPGQRVGCVAKRARGLLLLLRAGWRRRRARVCVESDGAALLRQERDVCERRGMHCASAQRTPRACLPANLPNKQRLSLSLSRSL